MTTKPASGHQGISFLIIDRGEGVTGRPIRKLGWHASDTAEIAFDDVLCRTATDSAPSTAASR
ncbi:MAG: hypothetical protein WAL22_09920 [Solirubrobacteraceae bacterium]